MGSREACSLLFLWQFASQEMFSTEWQLEFMEGLRFIKWISNNADESTLTILRATRGQQPHRTAHFPKLSNELVWSAVPCARYSKTSSSQHICNLKCNVIEEVKRKSTFVCEGRKWDFSQEGHTNLYMNKIVLSSVQTIYKKKFTIHTAGIKTQKICV